MHIRKIIVASLFLVLVPQVMFASSYAGNQYGPFDYSNPEHRKKYLPIVEQYHFNSDVENLKKAITGTVWGDTNYTLRIFPNHHRALITMSRIFLKKNKQHYGVPEGAVIEQHFQKAFSFAPHDPMVYMIYGMHLHKTGRFDEALIQYQKADTMLPESAEINYNLGLLYVDLKEYKEALSCAEKAYQLGYPLPGLRNKLKKAGIWDKSS